MKKELFKKHALMIWRRLVEKFKNYALYVYHDSESNYALRSRRGLVSSVLAYETKSKGSSPRPDIKTKYEKYFFGGFLLANYWEEL